MIYQQIRKLIIIPKVTRNPNGQNQVPYFEYIQGDYGRLHDHNYGKID